MREYLVKFSQMSRRWHIIRIEDGDETVLSFHFGERHEAEAVAKHLRQTKRPATEASRNPDSLQ